MELKNAVGILTGASRGIGTHLADHPARRGVRLALAARSEEGLADTAARLKLLGVDSITVPTDVTRKADLERLVERTTAELGPVDLLVNHAGIERYDAFEEVDPGPSRTARRAVRPASQQPRSFVTRRRRLKAGRYPNGSASATG